MKHSLINPSKVHFNGLDFFDDPVRDEELLYVGINDELVIPVKFKGTKCIFDSRVPTRQELESCPHFEMTSSREWIPNTVNLCDLRKLSQTTTIRRSIYKITKDTHVSTLTYPPMKPFSSRSLHHWSTSRRCAWHK